MYSLLIFLFQLTTEITALACVGVKARARKVTVHYKHPARKDPVRKDPVHRGTAPDQVHKGTVLLKRQVREGHTPDLPAHRPTEYRVLTSVVLYSERAIGPTGRLRITIHLDSYLKWTMCHVRKSVRRAFTNCRVFCFRHLSVINVVTATFFRSEGIFHTTSLHAFPFWHCSNISINVVPYVYISLSM